MTVTINEDVDRGRSTAAAAAARRRIGAHSAAKALAPRVQALSDQDLLSLADALLTEVERRGLPFWEEADGG